ncbi:MAG: toll/interleukin-1 receptor domain-containing protein, partial [Chloroflexota bacterium]
MTAQQSPRHVFISYRRIEPDQGFAYRLANDLYDAEHPIWIDVSGITGGEIWNREIQRGIDDCYAYVVILSPDSMESDWVRNELLYALQHKRGRVFPVMYREVSLPPELIAIQYVDFRHDYNSAFNQ